MNDQKRLYNKIKKLSDERDYLSMELAGMPKNCFQEREFKERLSKICNNLNKLQNIYRIKYCIN